MSTMMLMDGCKSKMPFQMVDIVDEPIGSPVKKSAESMLEEVETFSVIWGQV